MVNNIEFYSLKFNENTVKAYNLAITNQMTARSTFISVSKQR